MATITDPLRQPLLGPDSDSTPLSSRSPSPGSDADITCSQIAQKKIVLQPITREKQRYLRSVKVITTEHAVLPQPQEQSILLSSALQGSRAALTEIEKKHSSDVVATCADKVIPVSDKIAVYRNGYKLAITAISLVLVILAISGVASPVALALIGIGISLVSIAILIALVKAGKIGKKDACLLAFMTIASTFAIFYGGATALNILLAGYAISVIVQGVLFAGPQGLMAWGKGGYDKFQIAKKAGDSKHMITAAFGMNSGAMSAIEGTVWVFMGLLMLTAVLHPLIPAIPELLPKVLPYIITGLFLGIFNLSYAFMIGTGIRDYRIQKKFHDKMQAAFKAGETRSECTAALRVLKAKLIGKTEKTMALINKPKELQARLVKKAHRLKKVMDGNAFELVTIDKIEKLLKRLENEGDTAGFNLSKAFIRDIMSANERNMKLSKAQIKIGFAGLIVGTFVSLLEEFTNPGSVIHMPYIGHIATLSKTALAAISDISTIADCALWAYINHCFKKYLDAPDGRTKEEKLHLLLMGHCFEPKQADELTKKIKEIYEINIEKAAPETVIQAVTACFENFGMKANTVPFMLRMASTASGPTLASA